MTPLTLIEWGLALGAAVGAAVAGFVFVLDMLGIEWDDTTDRANRASRDKKT